MYKRLAKHLDRSRKPVWEVCRDLGIDYEVVDHQALEQHITQCTHCDIWTKHPVLDLDQNPICKVCLGISGL